MDVEQQLRAIVGRKVKVEFGDSTKLSELGLDSLDVLEIAFDIEDALKIELPQMGNEMLSITLGDLGRLVEKQLEAKKAASVVAPVSQSAASS